MIITIDGNTLPNEMHHIAVALQRIAAENGYVAPENITSINIDPTPEQVVALREVLKGGPRGGLQVVDTDGTVTPFVNMPDDVNHDLTDSTLLGSAVITIREPGVIHAVNVVATVESPVTNDNLDSAGLPWDARIHAGSRERNTDGSWRVRRRPKGVEDHEWNDTLARVTNELRDLMEIPVSTGAALDAVAETALTDDEIDQFVDIVQGVTGEIDQHGELVSSETVFVTPPVTTVAPPVVVAPPAIEPPVTAVAPPIATASPAIETFAQVMTFLTARTPKDEAAKPAMVAKVNEILAANGLTVLTQLGQRPDLIPQVVEQFKAAFGE